MTPETIREVIDSNADYAPLRMYTFEWKEYHRDVVVYHPFTRLEFALINLDVDGNAFVTNFAAVPKELHALATLAEELRIKLLGSG